jgi:hypothetical protein
MHMFTLLHVCYVAGCVGVGCVVWVLGVWCEGVHLSSAFEITRNSQIICRLNIHTYIHTYVHTYIHTYICTCMH